MAANWEPSCPASMAAFRFGVGSLHPTDLAADLRSERYAPISSALTIGCPRSRLTVITSHAGAFLGTEPGGGAAGRLGSCQRHHRISKGAVISHRHDRPLDGVLLRVRHHPPGYLRRVVPAISLAATDFSLGTLMPGERSGGMASIWTAVRCPERAPSAGWWPE